VVEEIARTDARGPCGFEEATERANCAIEAEAGMVLVETPEIFEEAKEIPRLVNGPCLLNMADPNSETPALSLNKFKDMSYKIVIYPTIAMSAAFFSIRDALKMLRETGIGWKASRWPAPNEFFTALGLNERREWKQKYAPARTV